MVHGSSDGHLYREADLSDANRERGKSLMSNLLKTVITSPLVMAISRETYH